jgi:hypothetical protein
MLYSAINLAPRAHSTVFCSGITNTSQQNHRMHLLLIHSPAVTQLPLSHVALGALDGAGSQPGEHVVGQDWPLTVLAAQAYVMQVVGDGGLSHAAS